MDDAALRNRLTAIERKIRRVSSVSAIQEMHGDLNMGGNRIVNLGKPLGDDDAATSSSGGGSDHGGLTGLGDDDHTQYLLAAGSRALSADWDAGSFKITAETLASDIATGTSPLTVASTTVVANLNADLLDGNEATAFATASHNHAASEITSGTLVHERGGLEADVSAFAGLVKITGGATSAVTVTAAGEAILDDANASAQRTTLGLVIGTDVQAEDATLSSIAALGTAADKVAYTTAVDTWAETALTSFARTILDDADAGTVRTTIGAGTGDGDALVANPLSQFAATTSAQLAGVITNETGSSAGLLVFNDSPTIVTPTIASFANAAHDHTNAAGGAQLDHTTALTNVGSNTHSTIDTHLAAANPHSGSQPLDSTLTSMALLGTAADKMAYTTGIDTWAETAITTAGRALIDDASASAQRTTLGLAIGTNIQAWDADLDAVAALASTGLAARTAANTWAQRSIAVADTKLTVSNADGAAGNPTLGFGSVASGDLSDTANILLADGTVALSAAWDAGSFQIRAETFQSDIATGTAPFTIASTTAVTNLNADQVDGRDETEFALLAGRAGSQTLIGGTASGEDLTLQSTANATKGSLFFGAAAASAYDEVNDRLGVGTATPSYRMHIQESALAGVLASASTALLIEENDHCVLQIATPTNKIGAVAFGDTGASVRGAFQYNHSFDLLQIFAAGVEQCRFSSTGLSVKTALNLAPLTVDQSSTTGARSTLSLDQADISEGVIDFIASARGTGSTAATNISESVRVELNGTVYRLALYVDA